MFYPDRSDDYTPIAVVGRFSIYGTELLLIIHIASMILHALWAATSGLAMGVTSLDFAEGYFPGLIVGKFQIWRLATYGLQNYPSLGFALGMLMLWWFGREVEKFYGRRNFLICYGALLLVPALIGLLPGLNFPLRGPQEAHFGIFLMFAATYPGVLLLFNIQTKWMAWVYLAIYSLIYLGQRNFSGLALLWLIALLAYSLTRWLGRGEWLPQRIQEALPAFGKPQFSVVREEKTKTPPRRESDPVSSIDPILEKIARSGMSSLSSKERAALESVSGQLKQKGPH